MKARIGLVSIRISRRTDIRRAAGEPNPRRSELEEWPGIDEPELLANIDAPIRRLAKRERECLHAWIQELDLECSIFHRPLLPDEVIKPVPLYCACTVVVGIDAMIVSRCRDVQFHGEADRPAI